MVYSILNIIKTEARTNINCIKINEIVMQNEKSFG